MRIRAHLFILLDTDRQTEPFLRCRCSNSLRPLRNLLVEHDDRLGPLVRQYRILSRECLELLKHLRFLFNLLCEFEHVKPALSEPVLVQVLHLHDEKLDFGAGVFWRWGVISLYTFLVFFYLGRGLSLHLRLSEDQVRLLWFVSKREFRRQLHI